MALFYAARRRDSLSLLKCPFLGYIQIFSCEISLVCRLKHPYSYFSSNFFFLSIVVLLIFMLLGLFLIVIISLSLVFIM